MPLLACCASGLLLFGLLGEVHRTGDLAAPRAVHTATLLPDGSVLIAGGMEGSGGSAETYEPARGIFQPTGSLVFERAGGHTAVLLLNGRVLIAGGWTGSAVTRTAELYDPLSGTFSRTGAMTSPRSGATATLLPSGKVLVVGGFDGDLRLSSAELYDPRTGTFTATGSLSRPRSEHASALLRDGRLLVSGGNRANRQVLASAEIYDPLTGRFTRTGDMRALRHKHAATTLLDGQVLVTGGSDARDGRGRHASAELFDPATGAFTAIGPMTAARFKHPQAVVRLRSGAVLLAGGHARSEVYDPATRSFHPSGASMGADLSFSTATLLPNGEVLIAGGYDQKIQPTARAWRYRPGRSTLR